MMSTLVRIAPLVGAIGYAMLLAGTTWLAWLFRPAWRGRTIVAVAVLPVPAGVVARPMRHMSQSGEIDASGMAIAICMFGGLLGGALLAIGLPRQPCRTHVARAAATMPRGSYPVPWG